MQLHLLQKEEGTIWLEINFVAYLLAATSHPLIYSLDQPLPIPRITKSLLRCQDIYVHFNPSSLDYRSRKLKLRLDYSYWQKTRFNNFCASAVQLTLAILFCFTVFVNSVLPCLFASLVALYLDWDAGTSGKFPFLSTDDRDRQWRLVKTKCVKQV